MLNIRTISVIGANGTMGAAVAGLLAAFGNAKVFLVCLTMEDAHQAVNSAVNSVKADSIRDKLIPKAYEDFENCVSQSDWVFESVPENFEVKCEVLKKISKCRKPNTIVTTGTSGLSINALSRNFDQQGQSYFFGTHFFNPPYSLTLCEVIRLTNTDTNLFDDMCVYLKDILYRDVIEVADTPAFLGNRIGFHFMNKALQYAVKYKKEGGIDYIDSILGPFTGRGMPPLSTIDFVGLDVHKAVVDNIYNNSNDYDKNAFILPDFMKNLINEGKLGKKTKEGLFKVTINAEGAKGYMVYDVETGVLRKSRKYDIPFAKEIVAQLAAGNYDKSIQSLKTDTSKEAMLCKHFLISYITYGITTAQSVSPQITDADIAMTTGFNWIGPLSLMHYMGGLDEILSMAKQVDYENNLVKQLDSLDRKNIKKIVVPSDYRKYLRAQFC